MNETDITTGGYVRSEMITTLDDVIYPTYIEPDFCSNTSNCHVITYRNSLSNSIDDSRTTQYGLVNGGASSNWDYYNRKIDLMSEVNVFGTTVWSSSGYDIGIDNQQYAIFQLRPELKNQDLTGNRYWYWLKGVASSEYFTRVGYSGTADYGPASDLRGVRPRFLIGTPDA